MGGSAMCPKCDRRFDRGVERCPHDGTQLVADRIGTLVAGRFLIDSFLGAGGGGASVWRASEIGREEGVAVKLMKTLDFATASRFERGARLAMSVSHPTIATVYEFGKHNDLRFLAMELLEGESLQTRLQREGALPMPVAVGIVAQVLDALEVTHAQQIVHRDLKPANLFLATVPDSDAVRVKLLDFGIAKRADRDAEDSGPIGLGHDHAPGISEITARHHICGTPDYMAPEQILGHRLRTAVDIYATGVLLYRLLAGTMPFVGKTRFELYHGHLTGAVPPMNTPAPLPEGLEALVTRALAKNPDERPASARAFRDELLRLTGVSHRSVQADATPSPVRALPGDFRDDGRTLEDDGAALVAYGTDRSDLIEVIQLATPPPTTPPPTEMSPSASVAPRDRGGLLTGRASVALGLVAAIVVAAIAVINA